MDLNQKQMDALVSILEYEQTHDPKEFSLGWSWSDVRVTLATLNNLVLKGLVWEKFRSNSYRGLLLTDLGREQASLLSEPTEAYEKPLDESLALSDDLFEDIIGHDEVKELLRAALLAEKPVHILLAGPPALVKSLFLWDIERVCGERAVWLVGSQRAKRGCRT
jgi:Holliday junction DNA helicase RuvB